LNFLLKAFHSVFYSWLNYTHHILYYLIYSKCHFFTYEITMIPYV
jgi:hypothetical protein